MRPRLSASWRAVCTSAQCLHSPSSSARRFLSSALPKLNKLPSIQNVLLVQKPQDARVSQAVKKVVTHIKESYPHVRLFYEAPSPLHTELPANAEVYDSTATGSKPSIDLVITLGGDGTILHASSLFSHGPVPPVLSFSLGTLGFLLPFHIESLETALSDVFHGRISVLPRMRLSCTMRGADGKEKPRANSIGAEVMNEVSLHRGRSPHLTSVDAYVDGQHLTAAVSDGLIVATPTGSTAYSLSSGGPIVHPSVHALLLTPVSPMSLSFRPLILPGTSTIRLQMNNHSRTLAYISMDGRDAGKLLPGEYLEIAASPHPIPCINRPLQIGDRGAAGAGGDNWVRDINTLLGFNVSFKANRGAF